MYNALSPANFEISQIFKYIDSKYSIESKNSIDSKFELKFSNFIALKIIFRPPPPENPCLTGAHECSENAYCQVSNYGDLSYNRKFLPYECICKGWSTIIF